MQLTLMTCALAMASVGLTGAYAQSQEGPSQVYDAEVFFQTTSFILPASVGYAFNDEGDLLITSDQTGIYNAYKVDVEEGQRTALTTSETTAHNALSWFPHDNRILVMADGGGDELYHIFVRHEDGTLEDLTPGENVRAFFRGWDKADAGFWMESNARDPQAMDLYHVSLDGFERVLVFENTEAMSLSVMSSDERWLALDKSRTSADSDIYIVDLQSAEKKPYLITAHEGNIAHSAYTFSPNSSALIYATNEYGEFNSAWSYQLDTGEREAYLTAPWDVSFVSYSPKGRYRISGINADGITEVTIIDLQTGEPLSLPESLPQGDMGSLRFNKDESLIAFTLGSSKSPSDIYTYVLGEEEAHKLTSALNPAITPEDLVEAEVVRFQSFDGLTIPGIMYKPLGASADHPVPALVWVHGGPGGQSRVGYSAAIQHLVNHGYAIYAVNNRGSSGYGKTFFHMDDRRHGEEDLRDIVAGGQYLRGLDWVRDDQVGVIGGSYGGFITAAALTFHPEEFDVGINIFGVTNWVRTLQSIPPWWESFKEALYDEMGDPASDAERHHAISPLFHAHNITKPLLVVQGANDPRVLQVESDELVEAARANGATVEYLLFDDEGHGFRNRDNKIAASQAYVSFLDTYLKQQGR
ncbi:S9 family peptidase [Woodsholea maritima]|uniref:S9 family peptidase n=1 Tax=Woodsholea maritima TaxID=240237 RepID=UPI000381DA82|nr:S9 family peptidase [Woodsholea maritima]